MEWLSDKQRFDSIEDNLKKIREGVAKAALASGRSEDAVKLMAVTKTVDSVFINHALSLGVDLIGENKVQEFLDKKPQLNLDGVRSHLIGHLQTNKVKKIVGQVDMIESVDTVHLAEEIGKRSAEAGIVTDILLEINAGNEESKFGFEYDEVIERAAEIALIKGVSVKGLMCVAPICEKESDLRQIFSNINALFIDNRLKNIDNINMEILSMGMSGDFIPAIAEGANLVRVGSGIFGMRSYR